MTLGPVSNLLAFAVVLLVVVPWTQPWAPAPSPPVVPWLASMVCAVALWALAGVRARQLRPFVLGAGCLVLWAGWAHAPPRPEVLMLAAGMLLVLLCAGAASNLRFARQLQAGLVAAAAVSSALALLQYFGAAATPRWWLSPANVGMAYANLRQPNHLASLCAIGAAVLIFGTLPWRCAAKRSLVCLLAVAAAASVSRTGLLEGAVLLALAGFWKGPQRQERLRHCLAAVASYAAASWLLPVLLEATQGVVSTRTLWLRVIGDTGCESRRILWDNVIHLIFRRPLVGWGWGELDYAHYITPYDGARFCAILDNAHNLPLHLAVELGIPAALLACGAFVVWVCRRRPWREASALRQSAWAVLAVLGVHSLLEYPLWYGPFQMALGLALGWLVAPGAPELEGEAGRRTRAVIALALAMAICHAAWDYLRVRQLYVEPELRFAWWKDDPEAPARNAWLFSGAARFADLTLTLPTASNAARTHALAQEVLHYSPEPRVIERLIESAMLLRRDEEAMRHVARYRAAFPAEYASWRLRHGGRLPP